MKLMDGLGSIGFSEYLAVVGLARIDCTSFRSEMRDIPVQVTPSPKTKKKKASASYDRTAGTAGEMF